MTENASQKTREVDFKLMLAGLIVLMLAGPIVYETTRWDNPDLLEIIFGGSFLLFVASFSDSKRIFWLAMVPALIAVICAVLTILLGSVIFRYLMLGAALAFFAIAVRYSSQEVFMASGVDFNKVIGSICIYLLLVFCWAIFYEFLEQLNPGSFVGMEISTTHSRFDAFVYFSLVTITTLGYGDTTPKTLVAGVSAGIEAVVGVFYVAILVASLVGDFMAQRSDRDMS